MFQTGQKVTHPMFDQPLTVTKIDPDGNGDLLEATDADGFPYLDYEDTFVLIEEDSTRPAE